MVPNVFKSHTWNHSFWEVFLIRGGEKDYHGKYDKFWQMLSKTKWNDSASAKMIANIAQKWLNLASGGPFSGTSSSWHHPGGSNFLLGMKRQPKGTSQGNRSRPSKTNQTGTASGRDPTGLFGGRWTTNRKKPLWGPCYALPCCCKKEMLIQKYRSVAHYLGHCLHLFFPNIPKSLYTLAAFYDLKAKSRFVS